jgi:ATP-dependent RNA helicase DeaD
MNPDINPDPQTQSTQPPVVTPPGDGGAATPPTPKGPTFAELGLHADVLRAVEEMGFSEPMPVQAATFPVITAGRDVMVQSRTGSGKTAAFGIPFANAIVKPEDKFVQAIVLLPTRELALQVASEMAKICTYRGITVVPVYGGAPMGRQVEQLRAGGQIVCGTPGRVLDHLRRGTLRLDQVRSAVLDECDEMLSMGFQEDIEQILQRTPAERQTLLFSATVPEGIQRLSRRFMRNPEFLKLSGDYVGVHEIKHLYYSIPGVQRENELLRILEFEEPKSAIIFCNTREETGRVAEFLRQHGNDAEAISSDLSQSDRERVLGRMRAGGIKYLVATDVAARGIDIENLSHVFNYTFPEAPEVYIHRTGRTGRAGRQGTAVSLIGPTEVGSFYYLKLLYKIKPEERALPSEAEIRSHREGERVQVLRRALAADPGGEWRALARRLMSAADGERLVAALLAQSYATVEGMPIAPAPVAPRREPEPRETSREHEPERERDRGDRDRAREPREREGRRFDGRERPPRERERDRDRPRAGSRDRDRERDRDRPRFGERGRDRGEDRPRRPPAPPRAPESGGDQPPEREFWEVWSDEKTAAAGGSAGTTGEPAAAEMGAAPRAPETGAADVARLYLNLGRKDGAAERDIRDLITTHAGEVTVADVEVMNTHTYLNVGPADADKICEALAGKELGGRSLICERAKPRRR